MSECTKCGTPTNNPAIDCTTMRGAGPLDEYNGVVWLCDNHMEEFRQWLDTERDDLRVSIGDFTSDGDSAIVTVGGSVYKVIHDPATGDWLVASHAEGDIPVQTYVKTRDGAIQYVLERTGVIEDGDYQRAPDRTSA